MPWIIPIQNTLLKLRPIDSNSKQLGTNEIRPRKAGDRLGVVAVRKAENNHWQVRLAGDLTIGNTKTRECYIWPGHWDGAAKALLATIDAGRQLAIKLNPGVVARSPDGTVKIPVAYKSQMDNSNNPTGSCNVTSAAMCLEYYGIKSPDDRQLEDVLYEWLQANGLSRHDPNHLKQAIEHFGCRDDFTTRASISEIKTAIDNGKPVIVHGYFTYPAGHIVVFIGYDSKGFIVHDPYGFWTASGYDRNDAANQRKGESVHYNYGMIDRVCLPDGGCWAHFVTRPNAPVPMQSRPAGIDAGQIGRAVKAMAHPDLPANEITQLVQACCSEFPKFDIETRNRIIHFLAQCGHESAGFYYLEELGNTAYFTENYEWRDDLGNNQAGDGARYKGRGLIQTTGRNNYQLLSNEVGINYVANPGLVATYPHALTSALVWWKRNRMNELCDRGLDDEDVKAVTRRINGGTNGLNDRLNRTDKLKLILV